MTTSAPTPKNDLTELAIVLDRSGSMQTIKDDMEGGLWSTIVEQAGQPGRCRVSLYQFDDVWEAVFESKVAGEIKPENCRLQPRGNTALHDAVVKSLSAMEARILAEPEDVRPSIVVVIVITDGQENASQENSLEDTRKAIARATDKFGWKFLFLAADQAGFAGGAAMMAGTSGRRMTYDKNATRAAHAVYSSAVSDMRSGKSRGLVIGESDDDGSAN